MDRVEEILKRLIRYSTNPDRKQCQAYREAIEVGKPIVPIIREKLLQDDWSEIHNHGKMLYLTCFMLLLHDIDPVESNRLREEITAGEKCNTAVIARLDTICSFSLQNYLEFKALGVRILIAKELKGLDGIQRLLHSWIANIDTRLLKEVDRIYVGKKKQNSYLGLYQPFLNVITLIWKKPVPAIEYSLYHEIGHYLDRSEEFDREMSEFSADSFAWNVFKEQHPVLCGRLFRPISVPILFRRIDSMHWKRFIEDEEKEIAKKNSKEILDIKNVNDILEKIQNQKTRNQEDIEELIQLLKNNRMTQVQILKFLKEKLKLKLTEADHMVLFSEAWKEELDLNLKVREAFFDELSSDD